MNVENNTFSSNEYTKVQKQNIEPIVIVPKAIEKAGDGISSKAITTVMQGLINVQSQKKQQVLRETLIESLKKHLYGERSYIKLEGKTTEELRLLNELARMESKNRAGESYKTFNSDDFEYFLDKNPNLNAVKDCALMTYQDEKGIQKGIFSGYSIRGFLEDGIDITSPNFKKLASITRNDANAMNTFYEYGDEFEDLRSINRDEYYKRANQSRHTAPRFTSTYIRKFFKQGVDVNSPRFEELLNANVNIKGELRPAFTEQVFAEYYNSDAPIENLRKISQVCCDHNGRVFTGFPAENILFANHKDFGTILELAEMPNLKNPDKFLFPDVIIENMIKKGVDLNLVRDLVNEVHQNFNPKKHNEDYGYKIILDAEDFVKEERDLKLLLNNIEDENFRAMLEDFYKTGKKSTLKDVEALADSYNNLRGHYTTIKMTNHDTPRYKKYLEYCRKEGYNEKNLPRYTDFLEEQKAGVFIDFCKYNNNEFTNYLYENVYLNNKVLPPDIKSACLDIHKKFGTKLFLPFNFDEKSEDAVGYIKQELEAWKDASGGKASYPPVLDLLKAKRDYIDDSRCYGDGRAIGFCESLNSKSISVDGYENVQSALRHEMTHANDERPNIKNWDVNQLKSKYWYELRRGGISEGHVDYAFKNAQEFIAVAMEGDLSKYSQEFIAKLKEFGLPKWALKLEKNVR